MTRFFTIAAQFGRFLPRLGPFGLRTAFLYGISESNRFGPKIFQNQTALSNSDAQPLLEMRIFGRSALRKSHLLVMRCTFNFCSAICELRSRFAALLGRFLPRLGPFGCERPFFFREAES